MEVFNLELNHQLEHACHIPVRIVGEEDSSDDCFFLSGACVFGGDRKLRGCRGIDEAIVRVIRSLPRRFEVPCGASDRYGRNLFRFSVGRSLGKEGNRSDHKKEKDRL